MKKLTLFVLAFTLAIFICFSSCSTDPEINDNDINNMISELISSGVFSEEMEPIGENSVNVIYDIADSASSFICYSGLSGAKAEEISVFKAPDDETATNFCAYLEAYRNSRLEQFEDYAPAEAPKLKEAIILKRGNYAIFAVTNNSALTRSIIEGYPKN